MEPKEIPKEIEIFHKEFFRASNKNNEELENNALETLAKFFEKLKINEIKSGRWDNFSRIRASLSEAIHPETGDTFYLISRNMGCKYCSTYGQDFNIIDLRQASLENAERIYEEYLTNGNVHPQDYSNVIHYTDPIIRIETTKQDSPGEFKNSMIEIPVIPEHPFYKMQKVITNFEKTREIISRIREEIKEK